jgi:Methyltransferase domain
VRNFIHKFFDRTFGKIIRIFQRSLINRKPVDLTLQDLVNQNAVQDSALYAIKNFSESMQFDARSELWSYCLNINPSRIGIVAEFGVWKGESINFFARNCKEARVFGFDSFEGLEEDWYGYKLQKGFFSMNGELPRVESNVKLIKGWFEDTVPNFIKELGGEQISILHVDVDTYKPSKYLLNAFAKNLTRGSIIIFDEYFGYTNWRSHEFRAFQEFVSNFGIKYKYIGYTNMAVAIEIL